LTILSQTGTFSYALQPTKYGSGTLAAVKAKAKIVLSANPADGNTVTVGSITYTFKTTLTPSANEVKIGTSASVTASNLAAAINAGAGAGTAYGTGTTANTDAVAVASNYTVFLTAAAAGVAGNALTLSRVGANITVTAFKGGVTAGAFPTSSLSWDRHKASDIDYDQASDQRTFPLEVDGIITPTGAYRAGVFVGGGATIIPRMQDKIGDLLLALMGSATTTQNSPVSGAHKHVFKFDPNDVSNIPWVSVRKHIPGRGGISGVGLIGYDNMLASMRLMLPQNDIVQARVDFAGRVPVLDNYPEAWLYANSSEGPNYAALSCKGSFKIPAFSANALPVTGVVIEMINNLTTPREEMVVGSYFMDDIVVRSRAMQIRFVYKWADPDLYHLIFSGSASGTDWTPSVYTTAYNSGDSTYAFEAEIQSAANVTGTTPYSLTIRAGTVVWQPTGPVRLQGGGILMQEYVGTVIEPDAGLGVPYCEFILINGNSSGYSVPAQS